MSDEIRRAILSPIRAVQSEKGPSRQTLENQLASIKSQGDEKSDRGLRQDGDVMRDGDARFDGYSNDVRLEREATEDQAQTENCDEISEPEANGAFELIGDVNEFILSASPIAALIADIKSWLKVDEKRTEVNPTVRTVTDIHLRDLIGYNKEQTGAQIASTCPEPVSKEYVLKEANSDNPQLSKGCEVEETIASGGLELTSDAV